MINKYRIILLVMLCVTAVCACNQNDTQNPPMTVSQEIAEGISENIIPAEAMEYSLLYYPVPEGFVAANDNTDMEAFYLSETQQDFSHIIYNRQPNDHLADFMAMTAEDYKDMLALGLKTEIDLEGCTQVEKEGWQQVDLIFAYEDDGISYKIWQYFYITDKYIFSIAYAQAGDAMWEEAFLESAAQVMPKSIVESVSEN